MEPKRPITRRRRWKRFKINGAARVLLHRQRIMDFGKPSLVELGPVVDISMGGLAVCYIENKKRMIHSEMLSLKIPDKGIPLEGVTFRTVSDRKIAWMPDGKIIHRRCVKFEILNAQQKLQVETFIRNHALPNVEDRRSETDRRRHQDPRFSDPARRDVCERRFSPERRIFQR